MTVIRGDAARRLVAGRRATSHHPAPVPADRPWTTAMASPYGLGASQTASEFVRRELTSHGQADRVPDATAVVIELVENAVRHGRGTVETTLSLAEDGRLTLGITDQGPVTPALRAALHRGDVHRPHDRTGHIASPPGSGLKLVALIAQSWGLRELTQGKTIWAQLHDHDVHCRGCHQL